ncbi:23S rRNA pseudouridine(2604) synthase RluF [Pseudobacter ginsenosidimutans]|uniref:Pseudouridine synthase n=1 Tax=Pseudobacter ginsenosidimutans TaxID=661488 RepID=A0A4Q7N0E5_9BACT|nr:23S rRNA pseudouridine(2604) synthase RluF [Pseudobacter ginsenosidimutans]RZS74733.1 ribosomal large subunit pseudouridine synthase F [Pseudobacter ginsenosidimutans]
MDNSISLNKFISDTGYCSRREADNLIREGRVMLNDQVAVLGNRFSPGDVVEVDGSLITPDNKGKRVYLALNKPAGITSTTEENVKGNIISFVGYPKRIFPIGRLDKDSEGLIFLTNDGDIINKILRAGNSHEKEYIVRLNKAADPHFAQRMSNGLPIMGTTTLPCKVIMINRQTFRIILTQGLNRQIRRMCEYLGYSVTGLQRVRIMNISLGNLPLGKWRNLSDAEVNMLKEAVSHSTGTAEKKEKKKQSGRHEQGKTTSNRSGTPHHPKTDRNKPAYKKDNPGFKEKHGSKEKSEFKDKPKFKDRAGYKKQTESKDKPGFKDKPFSKDKPGFKEKRGSGDRSQGSGKVKKSTGRKNFRSR